MDSRRVGNVRLDDVVCDADIGTGSRRNYGRDAAGDPRFA
jgi:hypothetical protein